MIHEGTLSSDVASASAALESSSDVAPGIGMGQQQRGYSQLGQTEDSLATGSWQNDAAVADATTLPGSLQHKLALAWSQASTVMRVMGILGLLFLLYLLRGWKLWFLLILLGILGIFRYRQHQVEAQREAILQGNMARIDQDRQESESMAHQAAKMILAMDKSHLEEFLIKNPSGSYEEWIRELHPDNVDQNGILDHRFYLEDSDHRQLWNDSLAGSVRDHVPSRSLQVRGDS